MNDLTINPGKISNVADFNPITDFMKVYKKNLDELKLDADGNESPQHILSLKDPSKIKDKELLSDLKVLLKGDKSVDAISTDTNSANAVSTSGTNVQDLSPDKLIKSFSSVFNKTINDVNTSQATAENAIETFASGGNIDLHTVMIAAEKSSLNMQMAVQLRTKMLQAYQEISRMSV